jgi:hypothetical protein
MKTAENHYFTLRVKLSDGMCVIRAFDGGNGLLGGYRIDVEVRMNGKIIFPIGATYCSTPACGGMSVDGVHAKDLVMSLVAMKLGDTDDEYFASYTSEQLAWAERYGEELDCERQTRYCDENGNVAR